MLVAFGANPSIRDIRGNSSLHMATAIRSSESLKILAESLASKDDVNAFNNFGELVIFFLNLHLCVYKLIFCSVLNIFYPPKNHLILGITPLHIAMMNDDKPCIDLLLRHGADPKILVS